MAPRTKEEFEALWDARKINRKAAALFYSLAHKNKCIWCSLEFPTGIMEADPGALKPMIDFFSADFLVHAKTTHGYDPDIINAMGQKACKE